LGLVRATITQEKPEARKALAASSCLLSFACCAIRAAEHSRLKANAAIVAFFKVLVAPDSSDAEQLGINAPQES